MFVVPYSCIYLINFIFCKAAISRSVLMCHTHGHRDIWIPVTINSAESLRSDSRIYMDSESAPVH